MEISNKSPSATYLALDAANLPQPEVSIASEQWFRQINLTQITALRNYLFATVWWNAPDSIRSQLDNIVDNVLAHHANPLLYPNRTRYRVDNVASFVCLLREEVRQRTLDAIRQNIRYQAYVTQTRPDPHVCPTPRRWPRFHEILTHPDLNPKERDLLRLLEAHQPQSVIRDRLGFHDQPSVCRAIRRIYQKIRSIPEFSL